jgi:ubiquinone/menaquinone biosynthesis C-methylase UbiE
MKLFRSIRRRPDVVQRQADAASLEDVDLAYRLILRRPPDEEGLHHYGQRIAEGHLHLEDVIRELLASGERSARLSRGVQGSTRGASAGSSLAAAPDARPPSADLIAPADVIGSFSVEELSETADLYYRRVSDPTPLMLKPYAFLQETPEMLENLGALLGGLHLGKTMRVLDFGAGTCWLSRILTQLHCEVICCDTSAAALEIGRRLYAEQPPQGPGLIDPVFLHFDGHRLALPDQSVDRIICFDAFHHIPNQEEVLSEFGRVLETGGIVGFSEPGPRHSQSPQAQYEMRNHRVLENDIDLPDIFAKARTAGFTELTVRVLCASQLSLDQYSAMFAAPDPADVRDRIWRDARNTLQNRSLFFLHKGPLVLDSRTHTGLAHAIEVATPAVTLQHEESARLSVRVTNSGSARWLHENTALHGTVRLGTHLYDAEGVLVDVDHSRHALPRSVDPGETIEMDIDVPVPASAGCRLELDLVSEGVRWFENEGSRPARVVVHRRPDAPVPPRQ